MANNEVKRPVKKKIKKSGKGWAVVFWICLALIVVPFGVLGWILISSSMDSSSPVIGSRYDGDLDPAITKAQMTEIQETVSGIEGVESADVEMATATLRVYADINDDANSDTASAKADEVYNAVAGILDPAVYFTQADGKKMYDLEIHVYNHLEETDAETYVYVIKNKSSSMSEPKTQLVSEPLDAELAQSLRDAVAAREAAEAQAEAEGGEVSTSDDSGAGAEAEGEATTDENAG